MKMQPLIASAAVTGAAAVGFAAAVDRFTPVPKTATITSPFATERASLRDVIPAPIPVAPPVTLAPPLRLLPAADIPESTLADLSLDQGLHTTGFPQPMTSRTSPLDDSSATRRYEFNSVPLIGVYR